jgi:hypothetical protein
MTYGPVTQGENFQFTGLLQLDTGEPLIGAVSGQLVFAPVIGEPATNQRFAATGAFTITNSETGAYTFTASPSDLTRLLAGHWVMQVAATLSSGQERLSSKMQLWVLAPL